MEKPSSHQGAISATYGALAHSKNPSNISRARCETCIQHNTCSAYLELRGVSVADCTRAEASCFHCCFCHLHRLNCFLGLLLGTGHFGFLYCCCTTVHISRNRAICCTRPSRAPSPPTRCPSARCAICCCSICCCVICCCSISCYFICCKPICWLIFFSRCPRAWLLLLAAVAAKRQALWWSRCAGGCCRCLPTLLRRGQRNHEFGLC